MQNFPLNICFAPCIICLFHLGSQVAMPLITHMCNSAQKKFDADTIDHG
jgi:hypothetical protein